MVASALQPALLHSDLETIDRFGLASINDALPAHKGYNSPLLLLAPKSIEILG